MVRANDDEVMTGGGPNPRNQYYVICGCSLREGTPTTILLGLELATGGAEREKHPLRFSNSRRTLATICRASADEAGAMASETFSALNFERKIL